MKRIFLTSSFSIQMLEQMTGDFSIEESSWEEISEIVEKLNSNDGIYYEDEGVIIKNAFGHENTCDIIKNQYDIDIKFNRVSLSVPNKSVIYVIQYVDGRTKEGQTKLDDNANFVPLKVIVK